jgi:DNA replication protein DnaC
MDLPRQTNEQRGLWREDATIPLQGKTFANFNRSLQTKAYDAVKNLHWQWDDALEKKPQSLVLLSPDLYGVGKTHLVCALAESIIETDEAARIHDRDGIVSITRFRDTPVRVFQENTLLRRIRATYNTGATETEEQVLRLLGEKTSLLIIDDVGKVKPRDPSFLQGIFFSIVDQRYTDEIPLVITTNLSLTELEEHIGGASADRLREMCGKSGFIVMTGTSYRRR